MISICCIRSTDDAFWQSFHLSAFRPSARHFGLTTRGLVHNSDFATSIQHSEFERVSDLPGTKLAASIDGMDTLTHGLEGILNDILKKTAHEFEALDLAFAVKSVITLV